MRERKIGFISNYFSNISVAAINITAGTLQLGDTVHIKGNTSDFEQKVESMQIDRAPVMGAKAGDSIGLRLNHRARKKDEVYKILPA